MKIISTVFQHIFQSWSALLPDRISQHLFVRNKSIAPIFSKVISWYFWVQNFNHFGTFKPTLEEVRRQIPLSILNLRINNGPHSRYRSMVCGVRLMMFILFKLQSYWHNISFNICLVSFFFAASCNNECYNFIKVIILSHSTIVYA